jgi:hypothetical protein
LFSGVIELKKAFLIDLNFIRTKSKQNEKLQK